MSMSIKRTASLAALPLAFALSGLGTGCELIVDFNRSLIEGGADGGFSYVDAGDASAFDASVPDVIQVPDSDMDVTYGDGSVSPSPDGSRDAPSDSVSDVMDATTADAASDAPGDASTSDSSPDGSRDAPSDSASDVMDATTADVASDAPGEASTSDSTVQDAPVG
jgi:hypothetical protein